MSWAEYSLPVVVAVEPYLIVALEIIWKSAIEVGWIWLWIERVTGLGWLRPAWAVDWTVTRSELLGGGVMRSEYEALPNRESWRSVHVCEGPAA